MSTKGRAGPLIPFTAGEALAAHRIVAMGDADAKVAYPAAETGPIIGVTDRPAELGAPVDVWVSGVVTVLYGAGIARGALLTANADGEAIATVTATHRIAGVALRTGVAGDLGLMLISQGVV